MLVNNEKEDLKYLEIIEAWAPDDETQTEYDCHTEDSIYAYVTTSNTHLGRNISIYLGKSWKEIYEKYFKESILEYLNEGNDEYRYFTQEQINFIKGA